MSSRQAPEWNPNTRISRIRVHREIFAAYAQLYDAARIMTAKLDAVLDHDAHQRLILTGLQQGYRMPDVEAVRARNNIIKLYLEGIDPYEGAVPHGETVEFPARTARQLHLVAKNSALLIGDVFRHINESEYMRLIRDMKANGPAYIGPTSLQEIFNVLSSLHHSHSSEQRLTKGRPGLPANWLKLVV